MSWNNWHLPSSCLDLTIVIACWLDNWINDCYSSACSERCWFNMVLNLRPRDSILDGLRQLHWLPLSQGFSLDCVWWCISSTLAAVRLTSVILCNSLLTMLVIQVCVLLQLYGTFYQESKTGLRTICGESAFSSSGPKALNSFPGRFHSIESIVSIKTNSSKHSI